MQRQAGGYGDQVAAFQSSTTNMIMSEGLTLAA